MKEKEYKCGSWKVLSNSERQFKTLNHLTNTYINRKAWKIKKKQLLWFYVDSGHIR